MTRSYGSLSSEYLPMLLMMFILNVENTKTSFYSFRPLCYRAKDAWTFFRLLDSDGSGVVALRL